MSAPSPRPPKLLIAEQEAAQPSALRRLLEGAGYSVLSQPADAALDKARELAPDLCLIDLGSAGKALAETLRAESDLGIIILTAGKARQVGVAGLEAGADDYLARPLDERELLARIRRLLWRLGAGASPLPQDDSRFGFAGWLLDVNQRQLRPPKGAPMKLSGSECRLLQALVESGGQVLSRDQLSQRVCNREWLPHDRYMDVLIGQLRGKFRRHDPDAAFIATIHGLGYLFSPRLA